MPEVVLGYPPQTREALWWTVRALFGVTIPRTRVCPDHCSPFDAFADAYFGTCTIDDERGEYECSRAIWHASRGLAGKSKTLSVLGLICGYLKGADITILGGSMAQSINVHEYMTKGLEAPNLPHDMVLDQTATKLILANRGRVRPLPASQRNVRGPHPSILLIDEVDEMELGIYDAALGQPMPQKNYLEDMVPTMTVISSTWQNADGTLTEIFRRCEELDPPDPIYRWCYKENLDTNNPVCPETGEYEGWLGIKTIEEKQRSVSKEMFRVEYDLGEPSIGNRAIDTEAVERMFCLDVAPIQKKEAKDFWEYRFERPSKHGTYVVGADWAKEKDYTVIWVNRVDLTHPRCVYWLRVNRRPYPVMIGHLDKVIAEYNIPDGSAWHDSTGLGNVVNDYVDIRARPFPMTGDKRSKMLAAAVNSIERLAGDGEPLYQLPKFLKRAFTEFKYARVGDLYAPAPDVSASAKSEETGASKYHLPDTFCAFALAHHAWNNGGSFEAPPLMEREDHHGKLAAQFEHPRDDAQDLRTFYEEDSGGEVSEISLLV